MEAPRSPHAQSDDPFVHAQEEKKKLIELATVAAKSYAELRQVCSANNLSATTLMVKSRERPEVRSIPEATRAEKDLAALMDVHRCMVEQHGLSCHLVRSLWEAVLDPREVAVMKCDRLL